MLCEGGPHLFGTLLDGGVPVDLFLTVAPQLAGRSAESAERRSLVEGVALAPFSRARRAALGAAGGRPPAAPLRHRRRAARLRRPDAEIRRTARRKLFGRRSSIWIAGSSQPAEDQIDTNDKETARESTYQPARAWDRAGRGPRPRGQHPPRRGPGHRALPYHQPAIMYTIGQTAAINGDTTVVRPAVQPPPILACLPVTPPSPIPGCVPPAPPAGEPWPVNMAYFGGHVQVDPKIYLIFYGWGRPGAFSTSAPPVPRATRFPVTPAARASGCSASSSSSAAPSGPACRPSTTRRSRTQRQTYNQYIQNPSNQFGGVWYDNTSPIDQNMTYTEIAQEAARGVAHFRATDLLNSQFLVIQPQNYSDPQASSVGYCAWHDYTEPGIEKGIYNGVKPNISFTNMPYILNQGSSCGENSVNAGAKGTLDGESIVLGHEIEETVTDPGAEDPAPNGTTSAPGTTSTSTRTATSARGWAPTRSS